MPEFEKEEYKFPDEIEDSKQEISIEIEDDTPAADRGREPLPENIVEELENDPLDDYSEKVKLRLKQMKKVWHDERRAKESAAREKEEALAVAQRLIDENRALKSRMTNTEKEAISASKVAMEAEVEAARRAYREAYESGDSEKLVEAQENLTSAKIKFDKLTAREESALQSEETDVQIESQVQQPVQDPKAVAWQQRNSWFGQDEEMTSLALGLHEKLKRSGVRVGSDDYYKRIDDTMRKRFPENFEEEQEVETQEDKPQVRTKPSTVVAPATRSTASKKVRLTNSQVAIAKKLGLTPEQYVRELLKMEAQ